MALVHEELSRHFHDWERRGRGWNLYSKPVRPEPPFRPFERQSQPEKASVDDGRRPTFLSSLAQKLAASLKQRPNDDSSPTVIEEPEPQPFEHCDLVELRTVLPAKLNITRAACAEFLTNLSFCQCPISFEIVGTNKEVALQFACDPSDALVVRRQLESHFPDGTFVQTEGTLQQAWYGSAAAEGLVVECGLAREFMFRLRTEDADPFIGIVGALSQLAEGEVALFQVLFESAREDWHDSIEYSVCHADGKPFFVNAPELAAAAKWKVMQQLYAAVVRIAVLSDSFDRTLAIARDLAGALRVYSDPQGNELIPLENEGYPYETHIDDMLARNSRRTGMLLTSDELVGFVHLPSAAVRSPALLRETGRTKAAPQIAQHSGGILLGHNTHAGETVEVRLSPEARVRHMHVIGASGTGKSTLLFNLIRQDIESGQGVALLDPHGDLVNRILGIIPENRINDVVLIDPADEEYSVGFNILSAHSDLEKNLLSSDLVGVFERLSTSWGDQMASVLRNAILAFLESDRGGTLSDLRRFLIEPAFRNEFLTTVRDPDIVYYWQKAFVQLAGNKSIGSVLTRLETFLAPKPIRYMVSQQENRLDFADIMDTGKIFLAKLPRGEMGEENSFLLGSFFVAKFQQAAMARQRQESKTRRDFWLYLDEAPNFMTPSVAEILSGTRKYRLGLILAHQDLGQLQRDRKVSSAVLSNPFTRVIFRVGDSDARSLESGLSFFEAKDLQNLEIGQAICRVEKANGDFNLSIVFDSQDTSEAEKTRRTIVVEASQRRYATPRKHIEADLGRKRVEDGPKRPPITRAPDEENSPVPEVPPAAVTQAAPKTVPDVKGPPIELSDAARAALEKTEEATARNHENRKPEELPRDSGKGGARHRIIQKRIKEAAEAAGFQATIEKSIENTQQTIDVFLERNDLTIACETSFETTADHEVGNVSKCLKAGTGIVAIICLDQNRLKKIQKAVIGTFAAAEASRVQYFEPSEFIAYLPTLPRPDAATTKTPTMFKGRAVKRSVANISADERASREAEYHRQIAEGLRKQKK